MQPTHKLSFFVIFICYFFWGSNLYAQKYVDSLRKAYGTDEYVTTEYFILEYSKKKWDGHDDFSFYCLPKIDKKEAEYYMSILDIKNKFDYENVTDSAENVLVKKNNKWGIWNFKKQFFSLTIDYDSILVVNAIEPSTAYHLKDRYINHFFLVLQQNKWYLIDSAFQKKDTMGYDSVIIDYYARSVVLWEKENYIIYNPFNDKLFYLNNIIKKHSGYSADKYIYFFYQNDKIGAINITDSVYYPPIYTKIVKDYFSLFLLKDTSTMHFLHLGYKKIILDLDNEVWFIGKFKETYHRLISPNTNYRFHYCDFYFMFKTTSNKYFFLQKKVDKYTLKTVPFIDILEPVYLLFLSPYYQKIE